MHVGREFLHHGRRLDGADDATFSVMVGRRDAPPNRRLLEPVAEVATAASGTDWPLPRQLQVLQRSIDPRSASLARAMTSMR